MKISVVTICFNSAHTLEDTIQSVLSQQYPQLEYIVVDGGSTDGTLDIIEKYKSHITHFISGPDKGIYDAMNKGLAMATGEVVGILNSDDVYAYNQVLHDVSETFKKSGAQGVYGDLVYVFRDDMNKIKRKWVSGEYVKGDFKKGWMPPHPTFFVKKNVYDTHGHFNTSLRSAADYELMLRFIHKFEITIAYIPNILIKMRQGGQSNASVKNRIKANREDRLAWKINGLSPGWFTLIRKPLRKVSQLWKR